MWTPPRAGQAAARVDTARRVPWATYDSQLQPRIDAAARLRTSPPTPARPVRAVRSATGQARADLSELGRALSVKAPFTASRWLQCFRRPKGPVQRRACRAGSLLSPSP